MDNLTNREAQAGIEAYGIDGIFQLVKELGLPSFRGKQLIQWIYHHQVTSYDDMTNLPKKMRSTLETQAPLRIPSIIDRRVSKDGSRKYVLALYDDCLVETVGIPSVETNSKGMPKRLTVCFSTQVGCPMQCAFCATGKEGLTRNLLPGEIAQQILTVQRDFDMKATNVVAMGQGEPFLNYDNVVQALRIINHPEAINIGARHITVSSCGITNGIERFKQEPEQFTLAISLHAARQDVRDRLMPKCKGMPLDQLKSVLLSYYDVAKRRITFEYLMINGVNDTDDDLYELIHYCDGMHVHINLIPLNDIEGSPWRPSPKDRIQHWLDILDQHGIGATLRNSKGSDIDGACGQLKNSLL